MFRSTAIITILSLGVSVVTFFNQLILAKYFGAGISMDIYLAFTSVPLLVSGLIVAALSYSLTPHLILEKALLKENFNPYVNKLFGRIVKYSFFISLAGCISLILLKTVFYPSSISRSEDGNWIAIFAWLSAFITVPIGFLTSYANSINKFRIPLLLSFLPSLFSIIFAVGTHQYFGIISVALGMFAGSLLSLVLFYFVFYNHSIFRNKAGGGVENFEARTAVFLKSMPVIMLAMLCFSVYPSIDAYWASKLGDAAVSYLGYCQRIIVAVGTLVIIGPSTVLIPRLSLAVAENRHEDFYSDTATVLKIIISIGSLCALIGSLCAYEIIKLLFERGAFTEIDTLNVSQLLPYMLVGIVFAISVVMLYRAFFVMNKIKSVAWLGMACAVIYFVTSGVGSNLIGLTGICIAYVITSMSIFIFSMHSLFKKDMSYIFNSKNLRFIATQFLLLAVTGTVVYFIKRFCISWFENLDAVIRTLLVLIFSAGLGILTYTALALTILNQPELSFLISGFNKKRVPRNLTA